MSIATAGSFSSFFFRSSTKAAATKERHKAAATPPAIAAIGKSDSSSICSTEIAVVVVGVVVVTVVFVVVVNELVSNVDAGMISIVVLSVMGVEVSIIVEIADVELAGISKGPLVNGNAVVVASGKGTHCGMFGSPPEQLRTEQVQLLGHDAKQFISITPRETRLQRHSTESAGQRDWISSNELGNGPVNPLRNKSKLCKSVI